MRQEPADFRVQNADQLAAFWHLDTCQPLDCKGKGMFLIHRCHIIKAVEIGNRLQIGLVLNQLFGTAMQQADMRINPLDDLAVEFQHKP